MLQRNKRQLNTWSITTATTTVQVNLRHHYVHYLSNSDEHYIPTLLSLMKRENETSCQRTITNVDWRAGGAHPHAYQPQEVNALCLQKLRRPDKRCSSTAAIRCWALTFVL